VSVDATQGQHLNFLFTDKEFFQDYAVHPLVHATNRHFAEKYQESQASGAWIGLTEIELRIKDFVRQQTIYSVKQTK